MRNNILLIAATCATMMACNSGETATNRIELPGMIDNEAFAVNVESISVMDLEMDDFWVFSDYYYTELSDNYLYMLDHKHFHLLCFDRHTGEKLSVRTIKGNGPGEIISVSSTFCIDDTLCIYNYSGVFKYDHNCRFIGNIQDFKNMGTSSYSLIRQKCGNLAHIIHDNILCDTAGATLILTDKSFNVLSSHFVTPHFNVFTYGGPESCYANNDTIRFFLSHDNHLYTLRGNTEECTELVVPNPMTPQIAGELISKSDYEQFNKYDSFWGLAGSGRFIVFRYRLDGEPHIAMVDTRTNQTVSLSQESESFASTSDIINCFFRNTWLIKTDGRFIYVGIQNHDLAEIFEADEKNLDDRLKKTRAEYRAYLERNAEYIKGLEPDERDAANVILKIKLKD